MQFVWNEKVIKSMPVRAYDPALHNKVKQGRDDVLLTHWILASETDSLMYQRFPNTEIEANQFMDDWVDAQLQRTNDTLGDPIGLRENRPWTFNSIASGMHGNDFPIGGGPHGSFSLPWDNDIAINLDMECGFFDASVFYYTLILMNQEAGNPLEMSSAVLNSVPFNFETKREWIVEAWIAGITRYKSAYPDNPVGCAYVPYLNRGSIKYWAAKKGTPAGDFMDSFFQTMLSPGGYTARMLEPLDYATIAATCGGSDQNRGHWPFEWTIVDNNENSGARLTDYFTRISEAADIAGVGNKLVWEIHNNYGPVVMGSDFVSNYFIDSPPRDHNCVTTNGTIMNHNIKDKWGENNQFGLPNPIDDWGYRDDTYIPGGAGFYLASDLINGEPPDTGNPFMTTEELTLWNRWYCGFSEPPRGWQESPNISDDTWLPFYPHIQTRKRYFNNGSDSDYSRWRTGVMKTDSERPGTSGLYYRTSMERWWASGYGKFKTVTGTGLSHEYFVADRGEGSQDSDWMEGQYLHYMESIRDRGVNQKRCLPERRTGTILNGPQNDSTPILASVYADIIDEAPSVGTNWKFVAHWVDDQDYDVITGEKIYSTLGSSEYGHLRGNELMFLGDPGCWWDPDEGLLGTLKEQPLTTGSDGGLPGQQVIWTPGIWHNNDDTRKHILKRANLDQWDAMLKCLYERMKNRILTNSKSEKNIADASGVDLVGEFGVMLYNMEIPNYDRCIFSIIQRAGLARLMGVVNDRTEIEWETRHILGPDDKSCQGVPTQFPFDIASEGLQNPPSFQEIKERLVLSQIKLERMVETFVDLVAYAKTVVDESDSPTLPDGSPSEFVGTPGRRIAVYQGPIGCDARYWHLCFNEPDIDPGAEGLYTMEVARDHIDGMMNATLYDAWNGDASYRLNLTGLPDQFSTVTREEMDEIRTNLGLGSSTKNIGELMVGSIDFNNAELYFSQSGSNMTMPLRNYIRAMEERLGQKAGVMISHAYEMKAASSNSMNSCDERPYEKHFPDVNVPTENDYLSNRLGGQIIGKFTGKVLENQTDQELDRNCVGVDFPWIPLEIWKHLVAGEDPVIPKTVMAISWQQWWPLTKWEWYLRGRESDGEPYPLSSAFGDTRLRTICDMCVPDSFDPELLDGEIYPGAWNTVGEFGDITRENALNFYKFIDYETEYARILFDLDPIEDPDVDPPITDLDPPLSDETLFIILQDSEIDPGTVDDEGGDPEDPGCDTVDEPDISPNDGSTIIDDSSTGGGRG